MKATRKLLAVLLAVLMTAALSVPAFAAGITPASDPQSGSTQVTYSVAEMYTVTIPASVTLDGDAVSVSVSAEGVIVQEGKQLVVRLTGTSGTGNAFTLSNGGTGTISYQVLKAASPLAIGGAVLTVNPSQGASGSSAITFENTTETPVFAGDYTGTVTFTVAVEAAPVD